MALVTSSQPNKILKFFSSKLYKIRARPFQGPALRFSSSKCWVIYHPCVPEQASQLATPKPTRSPINTSHPRHLLPSQEAENWGSRKCSQLPLPLKNSVFNCHGCQVGPGRRPPARASTSPVGLLLLHGVQARRQCLPCRVNTQPSNGCCVTPSCL